MAEVDYIGDAKYRRGPDGYSVECPCGWGSEHYKGQGDAARALGDHGRLEHDGED